MKEFWNRILMLLAAAGGWLGFFLGTSENDGLLYALIVFVVLDYVVGVLRAIVDKRLSSESGFKGLVKKSVMLMLVGLGNILDVHVLGQRSVIRTAVIFCEMSNEGISLLEHAAYLGVPIPASLREVLEQLHNKEANGKESVRKVIQNGSDKVANDENADDDNDAEINLESNQDSDADENSHIGKAKQ